MWYKVNKIYVWTNQVRPTWWTPWSNTVFYFPFTNDATDHSWNWFTLSNTWTQETIWRTFTTTTALNTATSWKFASVWIKINQRGSWWPSYWDQLMLGMINWNMYYQIVHANNSSETDVVFFWYWSGTRSTKKLNTSLWTWYHLAFYSDTNWWYCYLNWVKSTIWTGTPYNSVSTRSEFFNDNNSTKSSITLSEVIVENRVRSDSEILEYYNQTKSNYWLS